MGHKNLGPEVMGQGWGQSKDFMGCGFKGAEREER